MLRGTGGCCSPRLARQGAELAFLIGHLKPRCSRLGSACSKERIFNMQLEALQALSTSCSYARRLTAPRTACEGLDDKQVAKRAASFTVRNSCPAPERCFPAELANQSQYRHRIGFRLKWERCAWP